MRAQVSSDHQSAEEALGQAKELTLASRTKLTEYQNSQTTAQMDLRAKAREEVFTAARAKEVRTNLCVCHT